MRGTFVEHFLAANYTEVGEYFHALVLECLYPVVEKCCRRQAVVYYVL